MSARNPRGPVGYRNTPKRRTAGATEPACQVLWKSLTQLLEDTRGHERTGQELARLRRERDARGRHLEALAWTAQRRIAEGKPNRKASDYKPTLAERRAGFVRAAHVPGGYAKRGAA